MTGIRLFLVCGCCFASGMALEWWVHTRVCQADAMDKLTAIIGAAALDGAENGQRVRHYALMMESVWGGKVTNITVLPDRVIVKAVSGRRQYFDAMR